MINFDDPIDVRKFNEQQKDPISVFVYPEPLIKNDEVYVYCAYKNLDTIVKMISGSGLNAYLKTSGEFLEVTPRPQ